MGELMRGMRKYTLYIESRCVRHPAVVYVTVCKDLLYKQLCIQL